MLHIISVVVVVVVISVNLGIT